MLWCKRALLNNTLNKKMNFNKRIFFTNFKINNKDIKNKKQISTVISFKNEKFQSYCELMRIDKPQAILFVAAPALWTLGFLTNSGQLPDLILFSKLLLGSFFARTAECVINDYIDQDIDKQVFLINNLNKLKIERTKFRPLACQKVSKLEAIGITLVMLSASLGVLLSLPFAWYYFIY